MRQKIIHVALTPNEHETIQRIARAKGTTMRDLIRRMIQAVGSVDYDNGQHIGIFDRTGSRVAIIMGL